MTEPWMTAKERILSVYDIEPELIADEAIQLILADRWAVVEKLKRRLKHQSSCRLNPDYRTTQITDSDTCSCDLDAMIAEILETGNDG